MKIFKYLMFLFLLCAVWQLNLLPLLASESGAEAAVNINPLTIDPDLAFFTAIVFALLLLVLTFFAWRPLMAGLDQRERSIADMIDEAKRGSDEAAQKLHQYEQKLAAAAADAQEVVAKAKREATAAGEDLLESARQQAKRERERAVEDIRLAKNAAVQEIADQSADIAFTLARKLIQRELKPEDHAALIRETLKKLPSDN